MKENEMVDCLAKEISKTIESELMFSRILGDKYDQFAKNRFKTEEAESERKWPKALRSMRKPGSIAEQFDDFADYCEWCKEHNEKVGI